MEKFLVVVGIVVIIFGVAAVVTGVQSHENHVHNQNCKWIAPLKVDYVMCSDGVVRHK